jgi:hypothetical protein
MRRNSTGIILNTSALRINIDELGLTKACEMGINRVHSISWSSGSSMQIYTYFDKPYIELAYLFNKEEFKYKVYIEKVKSNLGKGFNCYFNCPYSQRLCKILYLAYDSKRFLSRYAYNGLIYYKTQKSSNLSYYNDRYWQLDERIEDIRKRKVVYYYKGVKTRKALLLDRLCNEMGILDEQRFTLGMPKCLKKIGFVV